MRTIDYSRIPEHCRHGMKDYIERGVVPGGFLCSVLENSLVDAFGKADLVNQKALLDYASFLYNEAPADCWGSAEDIILWSKAGGLEGLEKGNRLDRPSDLEKANDHSDDRMIDDYLETILDTVEEGEKTVSALRQILVDLVQDSRV
jgi:hypothetical protein